MLFSFHPVACALLLGAALLLHAPPAAAQPADSSAAVDPALSATLDALYATISGPAGAARNWGRFRTLFVPDARLIPVTHQDGVAAPALTVDEYIEQANAFFAENGFFEREIDRQVQRFDAMAHVFSTYASFRSADADEPFDRGINSIQLLHGEDGRWRIVTIFWESETADRPLPPAYLPDEPGA